MQQKGEINIQQEQNEETRIQKNEERLRNFWDNFKCSNIQIMGVMEGEEEEQNVENIFEQIMKENFPNLVKEIDFQEAQEAQGVSKKLDPRRNTPRHMIVKLPKIKDKERIFKAAREKERVTYKGLPIRRSADFSKDKGLERSIPSHERLGPTSKMTLSSKAIIQNRRADKVLLR